MPYTGEHSARINPPGKYVKLRRQNNKFGKGIHPIFGILKEGGSEVQSIHFDSSQFTVDEAKAWLKENDYKPIEFEPAIEPDADEKEQEQQPGPHRRFLSVEMVPSSDIQHIDGGLLVPGVTLLAPGTWTDSTQKTPCRYTPEKLERYHANWEDFSYWSRHAGGTPRDITDRIADIKNIRYQGSVKGDLFYHGVTSKSKDAIAVIEAAAAGKVPWPYSSVEMYTSDHWIVSEKLHEADEITFTGAAMVNQGACRTCKIRNNEAAGWYETTDREGKPAETPSVKQMERKEQSAASGSLEDLRDKLQAAIREKFGKTGDGMEKYGTWVVATYPDRCIFEAPDSLKYEVTYSPADDGTITFGEPVEVEITYQPKEQEMPDNKELEAENARLKKELEDLKNRPPAEPPKVEIPKELTESIATLVNDNKELKARLKALEENGDPKTGGTRQVELAEPINTNILVDRETGTIRSV